MHPHPASLLVSWLAFLLAVAATSGPRLVFVSCLAVITALLVSGQHLRRLLYRSRYLLLMLGLLFGWMTPGTPVSLVPGASLEGLLLAFDQGARLLTALAALSIVLQVLSPLQLVVGMRVLLAPLVVLGLSRDCFAVRLALTLEDLERAQAPQVLPATHLLHLPQAALTPLDAALWVGSVFMLAVAYLT